MVNPNIINLELPFKLDEVANEAMAKEANKYYSGIYIFLELCKHGYQFN